MPTYKILQTLTINYELIIDTDTADEALKLAHDTDIEKWTTLDYDIYEELIQPNN